MQPEPTSRKPSRVPSARSWRFILDVLSLDLFKSLDLFQAILFRVVADDRGCEDLRNVLHRLRRQLLQAIEVPEVALLPAPAAGLVGGHVAQHLAQAVLALV